MVCILIKDDAAPFPPRFDAVTLIPYQVPGCNSINARLVF